MKESSGRPAAIVDPSSPSSIGARSARSTGEGRRPPHSLAPLNHGPCTSNVNAQPWTATVAAYIAHNCDFREQDYAVDDEPQVRRPPKKSEEALLDKQDDVQQLLSREFLLKIEDIVPRLATLEELVRSVQAQVVCGLQRVEMAAAFGPAPDTSQQTAIGPKQHVERIPAWLQDWRSEQQQSQKELARVVQSQVEVGLERLKQASAAAAAHHVRRKLQESLDGHIEHTSEPLAPVGSQSLCVSMDQVHANAKHGDDALGLVSQPKKRSKPSPRDAASPSCRLASDCQERAPTALSVSRSSETPKIFGTTTLESVIRESAVAGTNGEDSAAGADKARSFVSRLARQYDRWIEFLADQEPPPPPSCCGMSSQRSHTMSQKMENVAHVVIFLNVAFLWHSANREVVATVTGVGISSRQEEVEFVLNWLFAVFFTVEIILRIAVDKTYFLLGHHKWWNIVDTLLVIVSYVDIAGTVSFLRAFRVLRVAKLLRLHRMFHDFGLHELTIMVDCLAGSLRLLFWCLCVIALMNILFALLLVQLLTLHFDPSLDYDQEWVDAVVLSFGSVEIASFTLFTIVSGGTDWKDVYDLVRPAGAVESLVIVLYVVLFYVAVVNVVTSTFVDKAFKLAKAHNEALALREADQQQKEDVKDLRAFFESMDVDCDGTISPDEFQRCIDQPAFVLFLQERGLHVTNAKLLLRILADQLSGGKLDLAGLVDFCLRNRGNATRIDLLMLEHQMHSMQVQILQDMRRRHQA